MAFAEPLVEKTRVAERVAQDINRVTAAEHARRAVVWTLDAGYTVFKYSMAPIVIAVMATGLIEMDNPGKVDQWINKAAAFLGMG